MRCITKKAEENLGHISGDCNNDRLQYHKTKGSKEKQGTQRRSELATLIHPVHMATRWRLPPKGIYYFPYFQFLFLCSQQPYEVDRAAL